MDEMKLAEMLRRDGPVAPPAPAGEWERLAAPVFERLRAWWEADHA